MNHTLDGPDLTWQRELEERARITQLESDFERMRPHRNPLFDRRSMVMAMIGSSLITAAGIAAIIAHAFHWF